jgi:hypothetical protein
VIPESHCLSVLPDMVDGISLAIVNFESGNSEFFGSLFFFDFPREG